MFALQSGEVITDQNVRTVARQLPFLGSGVSRSVYDLGDVVLKVDDGSHYAGNCASEVAAWREYEGTEHEHLFARVLASGRGWIIAEKAEPDCRLYSSSVGIEVINQLEWIGIGDLHSGNIGFRADGSGCAIDYAMNSHRGNLNSSDIVSSDPCECFEHDCRNCWPDGCDCCCSLHRGGDVCLTYEGCDAIECDDCYKPAVVHEHERGTWFGFKYGIPMCRQGQPNGMVRTPGIVHYCAACNPAVVVVPEHKEIPGQRGFLIWSGQMLLPWEAAN